MKLSTVEKILVVATLVIFCLYLAKGKSKLQPSEQAAPITKTETENPSVQEITIAEAELQLQIFSRELDVRYDDMQEVTFYSCRNAGRSPLYFIPYVSIDKQYKPKLLLQIFNISNYPLYFDKLYIKTGEKVYTFNLGTRKSSYNERMSWEIYQSLKEGIKSGYIKFRVAGNDIGERELTAGEIEGIEEVFAIYEYFSKVKVTN